MEEMAGIIFAALLFVLVPVIFMCLKHQQKMAAILHEAATGSLRSPPTRCS